jgi:hypothetical protein
MSTAYHPQTDGMSERKNQEVGIAIHCHIAMNDEIPWVDILPALQHNLVSVRVVEPVHVNRDAVTVSAFGHHWSRESHHHGLLW